jgi:elongation factor Ts
MAITMELVKDVRQRTGAGVLDVKKALESTGGDVDAAIQALREKGLAKAAKKSSRDASEGAIVSYLHGEPPRVGVLLELNCETDFVARTDAFKTLCRNVAMQIAALGPQYVDPESVPEDVVAVEKQTIAAQMEGENKPPEIMERIITGRLDKWYEEVTLLRQPYMRDDSITVEELVTRGIAELGENIVVRRFTRFELGEKA